MTEKNMSLERILKRLSEMKPEEIEETLRIGGRAARDLPQSERLPEGFELKKVYDLACPYCSAALTMHPSAGMQMGFNYGGGKCLACKKHFNIRIDTRNNSAVGICFEVPGA